jgi:hypothetical protein
MRYPVFAKHSADSLQNLESSKKKGKKSRVARRPETEAESKKRKGRKKSGKKTPKSALFRTENALWGGVVWVCVGVCVCVCVCVCAKIGPKPLSTRISLSCPKRKTFRTNIFILPARNRKFSLSGAKDRAQHITYKSEEALIGGAGPKSPAPFKKALRLTKTKNITSLNQWFPNYTIEK